MGVGCPIKQAFITLGEKGSGKLTFRDMRIISGSWLEKHSGPENKISLFSSNLFQFCLLELEQSSYINSQVVKTSVLGTRAIDLHTYRREHFGDES